jgi:hypothetical protein
MAIHAREAHLPTLAEHRRREIGNELQVTLIELIDLSLIGTQLHWNIFGRPFNRCTSTSTGSSTHGASSPTTSPNAGRARRRPRRSGWTPERQLQHRAGRRGRTGHRHGNTRLVTRLAVIAERIRSRTGRLGDLDVASLREPGWRQYGRLLLVRSDRLAGRLGTSASLRERARTPVRRSLTGTGAVDGPPRPWHLRPHGGALPGRGADRMNRLAGCPSRLAAEPVVRLAPTDRAARRFGRRRRSCRLPCPWQASAPSPRRWPTPW